jgi:alpha-1,2-mannosyltransferase
MSARMAVALIGAAFFVTGLVAWLADWHVGADSAAYRAGATALVRGEEVYSAQTLSAAPWWRPLPFTYPPAAALLFTPLVLLPMEVCWGLLNALSVLALGVAVKLSLDAVRDDTSGRPRWLPHAALTVLLVALMFALEPVWHTFYLGQINLILMAMVLVDVLVLGTGPGRRWGGVLIGVAAAVKLTPLIFVVHLLLTGRVAQAGRALATFAGLQLLMFALSPSNATAYWTKAVTDPERIGTTHWISNQSLNGLVRRVSEGASWSTVVALGIGAVLAVPAVILVRRLHRAGRALEALLVSGFLALLLSPVSWSHHWVWAVPLITVLAARTHWWRAGALFVVFASCVVLFVPNGGRREFDWNAFELLLGSSYLLVPLVSAAVLGWRLAAVHQGATLVGVRRGT